MDPRVKPAGDSGKSRDIMATFHFDLVSPEKLAFSGEVDQVDVPGVEGDFGVLSGHAPVVAAIRPGILTVTTGGTHQKIIVLGGLAPRKTAPNSTARSSGSIISRAFRTSSIRRHCIKPAEVPVRLLLTACGRLIPRISQNAAPPSDRPRA
jgi:hypothetical protein